MYFASMGLQVWVSVKNFGSVSPPNINVVTLNNTISLCWHDQHQGPPGTEPSGESGKVCGRLPSSRQDDRVRYRELPGSFKESELHTNFAMHLITSFDGNFDCSLLTSLSPAVFHRWEYEPKRHGGNAELPRWWLHTVHAFLQRWSVVWEMCKYSYTSSKCFLIWWIKDSERIWDKAGNFFIG